MSRVDYYQDPDAPKPNSIVIAVSTLVLDDASRLLMIRRTDNNLYALPGGRHELGETVTDTAVHETREETGLEVAVDGLLGIFSNPEHVMAYTDGEVRQEFSICFRAHVTGGAPRTSGESSEVVWADRAQLVDIEVHPSIRMRIDRGFSNAQEPYYT